MKAIRTDFSGYEGRYVAVDRRSRQVVIADRDPKVVLEKARGRRTLWWSAGSRRRASRSTTVSADRGRPPSALPSLAGVLDDQLQARFGDRDQVQHLAAIV